MASFRCQIALWAVAAVAACSSGTSGDAGLIDGGCPGCDLVGCAIDGVIYDAGVLNPSSVCQVCAPADSRTGWTNVAAGSVCDAGSVCASGQCLPGCFIDGFYAAADAGNPFDSCELCNPTASFTSWTVVGADGTPCVGDGGDFCLSGSCVSECSIDGAFYAAGASNPQETCQSCQPDLSFQGWSFAPDQTVCSEDGGNLCLSGACVAGCFIDGGLEAPGSATAANGCFGCQPQLSVAVNTQLPDGTACATGGGTVCRSGACLKGCDIGGAFFPNGVYDGGNPNVCCNGAANPTAWTPAFGAAGAVQTTLEPEAVAIGDVNGDGFLDLVVAHPGMGQIGILLGDGKGNFQAEQLILVGLGPRAVALAALTASKRTDVVALNGGNSTLAILVQQSDGSLVPGLGSPLSVPPGPSGVAIADVNNDELADLLVSNDTSGGQVTVWLANPIDGGFQPGQSFAVGMQPVGLAVANFERDGSPDVVTANVGDSTLTLLHNTGPGVFSQPGASVALPVLPSALVAADFNGDGYPDVAVAGQGADGGVVAVFLNQGSAPWFNANPTLFPAGPFPSAMAAADLNGDGTIDLAVTSQTGGAVEVLLNLTAPTSTPAVFLPPASYAVGRQPTGIAVGKLVTNGTPSLAVANVGTDYVSVLNGDCQ